MPTSVTDGSVSQYGSQYLCNVWGSTPLTGVDDPSAATLLCAPNGGGDDSSYNSSTLLCDLAPPTSGVPGTIEIPGGTGEPGLVEVCRPKMDAYFNCVDAALLKPCTTGAVDAPVNDTCRPEMDSYLTCIGADSPPQYGDDNWVPPTDPVDTVPQYGDDDWVCTGTCPPGETPTCNTEGVFTGTCSNSNMPPGAVGGSAEMPARPQVDRPNGPGPGCKPLDCYQECAKKDSEKLKQCKAENDKHVEKMKQMGCKGTRCSTKSFSKTCRKRKTPKRRVC